MFGWDSKTLWGGLYILRGGIYFGAKEKFSGGIQTLVAFKHQADTRLWLCTSYFSKIVYFILGRGLCLGGGRLSLHNVFLSCFFFFSSLSLLGLLRFGLLFFFFLASLLDQKKLECQ